MFASVLRWPRSLPGEGSAVLDCRAKDFLLQILSFFAVSSFLNLPGRMFLLFSDALCGQLLMTWLLFIGFMEADWRFYGAELKKSKGNAPWLFTIDGYTFFIDILFFNVLLCKFTDAIKFK